MAFESFFANQFYPLNRLLEKTYRQTCLSHRESPHMQDSRLSFCHSFPLLPFHFARKTSVPLTGTFSKKHKSMHIYAKATAYLCRNRGFSACLCIFIHHTADGRPGKHGLPTHCPPTDDLSSAGGPYITRRRTTCRTAGGDVKTGEKGTERRIFRTEGQVSKC